MMEAVRSLNLCLFLILLMISQRNQVNSQVFPLMEAPAGSPTETVPGHGTAAGTEHVPGGGTEHVTGEGTEHVTGGGTEHVPGGGTEHVTGEGTGHDNATGGGGHGAAVITTLPIVTWKWHHVETPYLVALWVLVCWLCKLGELFHHSAF